MNCLEMNAEERIEYLENEVKFLKKALAYALKDETLVLHHKQDVLKDDIEENPEFNLGENISGEIIIRVKRHGK